MSHTPSPELSRPPALAVKAVLFDLDGTLVDSAPDLAGALNALRQAHGLLPMPYEQLRPMVGAGARGMIGVGFGVGPEQPEFAALRDQFLDLYAANLLQQTALFSGMAALLAALNAASMPWGVVTNKASRFAVPLVAGLGWPSPPQVLICGDTTAHAKPHPEPLLEAARRLVVDPAAVVYVGDDLRDVQAGRAAGMRTVAAGWGYLGQGDPIEAWGADAVIKEPGQLLNELNLA
jgi:phosphoglycolate phosphatase